MRRNNITVELGVRCAAVLAPPPKLTVSEWADENRILPETSAEPGQWHTYRAPWTQAPMDACADPEIHNVVLMWAAQTAKTETLLNITGYHIEHDSCAMLWIQPTIEDAEDFSKERLEPMLCDSGSLAAKVAEPKSRNSSSTIKRKDFPGGFVGLVGANAPRGLRRRPVRLVVADEIDGYPRSSGKEGNPLDLAKKRTTTFWNWLVVMASTPTRAGESAIENEYADSTQEIWKIPCPSCGHYQDFNWDRIVFHKDCGAQSGMENDNRPDEPQMVCEKCGCLHGEYEWKAGEGEWVARKKHKHTRGFHINSLASNWIHWTELIEEFIKAKREGIESLMVWWNTRLGLVWEEAGEKIDEETLANRRHYYECDVPAGAVWITAGVDVQKDRLEMEIVGWGVGKESWGIQYAMILGDPQHMAVWNELDALLQRTLRRSDGQILPISCTTVDSGYATSAVYSFCKKRTARHIYAVKGQGGPGKPVVGAYNVQNKRYILFPVGTDAAKDVTLSRLLTDDEGPDYCHFPREEFFGDRLQVTGDRLQEEKERRGYNEDYFRGLMSEHRVLHKSMGRTYHTWKKNVSGGRNEPLDCRVYATAALEIRNPDLEAIRGAEGRGQRARRRRSPGVEV